MAFEMRQTVGKDQQIDDGTCETSQTAGDDQQIDDGTCETSHWVEVSRSTMDIMGVEQFDHEKMRKSSKYVT